MQDFFESTEVREKFNISITCKKCGKPAYYSTREYPCDLCGSHTESEIRCHHCDITVEKKGY